MVHDFCINRFKKFSRLVQIDYAMTKCRVKCAISGLNFKLLQNHNIKYLIETNYINILSYINHKTFVKFLLVLNFSEMALLNIMFVLTKLSGNLVCFFPMKLNLQPDELLSDNVTKLYYFCDQTVLYMLDKRVTQSFIHHNALSNHQ